MINWLSAVMLLLLSFNALSDTISTKETEVSCPTAQSMANVTSFLKDARKARGLDAARYSGMIQGHGCSVLNKGIILEIIEKVRITDTDWIVLLCRLPTGMTTYIAREKAEMNVQSSRPSRRSSGQTIVTDESEINCPTAQSMANVTSFIKKARSARGLDAAMYSGMIQGHGCSVLTKGIRLDVVEKLQVEDSNWLVILGRLPDGMTTYVARESGASSQTRSRREEILELQRSLKAAGYDPGPIDGVFGQKTKRALEAYKRDHPE